MLEFAKQIPSRTRWSPPGLRNTVCGALALFLIARSAGIVAQGAAPVVTSKQPLLAPQKVHVVPELTVSASDETSMLSSVADIAVTRGGAILVSDPKAGNVKVF